MAAHQQHLQLVVPQLLPELDSTGQRRWFRIASQVSGGGQQVRRLSRRKIDAADRINCAISRHTKQPSCGIVGDAMERPTLQGFAQGILDNFFGDVEMLGAQQAG